MDKDELIKKIKEAAHGRSLLEAVEQIGRILGRPGLVGPVQLSADFLCRQGKVTIRFAARYRDLQEAMGQGRPEEIWHRSPGILTQVTNEVQIVIRPAEMREGQISARFSPAECVTIMEGEWPSSKNYSLLAGAVRERKYYPMPTPEIPGSGGKSMSAQGQTKKPGSHSEDRHH